MSITSEAADICSPYKGMKKVYWDGIELKPGQIGRLIIMKDTPLFSLKGVFSKAISSVQVNDRKEVFILDENRKLLTKYNNIKDIKLVTDVAGGLTKS